LFVHLKTPAAGPQETRFVFEIPEEEFQDMVSLVIKFEDWSAICSQETPKPTVEKIIGTLGSVECVFRYSRHGGGALMIGGNVLLEEDAQHFLALSTTAKELAEENREVQAKNISIAERLK
jgi:hypothetical protein